MSLPIIFPVVVLRSSWIWVSPVGPSPTTRTLSDFLTLARRIARMQHAVGSIIAPSSNESSGGKGITAPLVTWYCGTLKYSAKPLGSMVVFLNSLQCVELAAVLAECCEQGT